jgi:mRNA-degrading endonuclease YafQ of YafQ-DinJ toxin-antitoxin module
MEVLFSDTFLESLKKYSSIKKNIKKKVDMIIEHPIELGEPLKGNFRGYYSCPVKKNSLVVFLYCKICRKKGNNEIVLCKDCDDCTDDTIKFIDLGPHDRAYGKK